MSEPTTAGDGGTSGATQGLQIVFRVVPILIKDEFLAKCGFTGCNFWASHRQTCDEHAKNVHNADSYRKQKRTFSIVWRYDDKEGTAVAGENRVFRRDLGFFVTSGTLQTRVSGPPEGMVPLDVAKRLQLLHICPLQQQDGLVHHHHFLYNQSLNRCPDQLHLQDGDVQQSHYYYHFNPTRLVNTCACGTYQEHAAHTVAVPAPLPAAGVLQHGLIHGHLPPSARLSAPPQQEQQQHQQHLQQAPPQIVVSDADDSLNTLNGFATPTDGGSLDPGQAFFGNEN